MLASADDVADIVFVFVFFTYIYIIKCVLCVLWGFFLLFVMMDQCEALVHSYLFVIEI